MYRSRSSVLYSFFPSEGGCRGIMENGNLTQPGSTCIKPLTFKMQASISLSVSSPGEGGTPYKGLMEKCGQPG